MSHKYLLTVIVGAVLAGAACGSEPAPSPTPIQSVRTLLTAARPSGNTGTGFFVSGGRVFDPNGNEFVIRGTNYEVWADVRDQNTAIAGMNRARINAARLNFPAGTSPGTEVFNGSTVQRFVNAGIVPIVAGFSPSGQWPEPSDSPEARATVTTCSDNPAPLNAAVDNWVGPQRSWLVNNEKYVVLNIANEWGSADTAWRDAYIGAVRRIRSAGIKAMIMIDAGGSCGQNAQSIESYGNAIVAADPQHNIVFSLHMYAFWRNSADPEIGAWGDPFPNERMPYDMSAELERVRASGQAIVVGEYCGWPGSVEDDQCAFALEPALAAFESKGVGYMSWEWMNVHVPVASVTLDNRYTRSSDLSYWGRTTIEHPTLGSQALARPATIFASGGGGGGGGSGGSSNGGAVSTGGTAGSGGSGGSPGAAQYDFESGKQGWLSHTPGLTLSASSVRSYRGSSALAADISSYGQQTLSSQVDDPTTPAGSTLTAHVWCPSSAPISTVTAWVQNAGEDNGRCPAYQWTGASATLAPAQWTRVSVTVPSCSLPLSHLGVDFDVAGTWAGTCYVDTVGW